MPNVENHKELVPFEHYTGLFSELDPLEAAERCGVKYDAERQVFTVRLLYVDYEISWPRFAIRSDTADGFALGNLPAQMLIIRFLLEGKKSSGSGLGSWLGNLLGPSFSKSTYTAAITVTAENTEVESVAYSTNGGSSWTNGTSFTSSSNITDFDIRVIAANGQTYYFTYSNGTVTEVA